MSDDPMSDDYGYFDPHDPSIHALAEHLAEALGVPVGVHDHYLTLHVKIRDARRLLSKQEVDR